MYIYSLALDITPRGETIWAISQRAEDFLRAGAPFLWTAAGADSMESLQPKWKSVIFIDKAKLCCSCLALRLNFSIETYTSLRRQDTAAVRSRRTGQSLSSGC